MKHLFTVIIGVFLERYALWQLSEGRVFTRAGNGIERADHPVFFWGLLVTYMVFSGIVVLYGLFKLFGKEPAFIKAIDEFVSRKHGKRAR